MKSIARIFIALTLVCAFASPSLAGTATGQKAMKSAACKKEAKAKKLSGSDRRAFLKECVAKPA
jgi:hypothetical protein